MLFVGILIAAIASLTLLALRRDRVALGGGVAIMLGVSMLIASNTASAAHPTVNLGTAESFAVLAGTRVTNTGESVISGDVGVSPGTEIIGFPPGVITNGTEHAADEVAAQAQADLTTAYNDAAGRVATPLASTELGGQTLTDGTYSGPTLSLTGTLTLSGDPSSVFIFQAGSTLITASDSSVVLVGGADACNVFWQVGSSATLGTGTDFVGTIMALTSITANTGATVEGRLLARNGAVTLDTNTVTAPLCEPLPTTTTTTTAGPTTTTTTGPTTTTTGPTTTTTAPTTTTTAPTTTTTAPTTTTAAAVTPTTATTTTTAPVSTGAGTATPTNVGAGETTTVRGGGFAPNTPLQITMDGAPSAPSASSSDRAGNYAVTLTIPMSTTAGTHRIVVTGMGENGASRQSITTIQVTRNSTGLSVTGTSIGRAGLIGVFLIALGFALLLMSARRDPNAGVPSGRSHSRA